MELTFKVDSDHGTIEVYADGRYVGDISRSHADEVADRLKEITAG